MIQALLSWAVDNWHVLESRVVLLTLARVDGPVSPLDLDPRRFIALQEGVVREDPTFSTDNLNALWNSARDEQTTTPVDARAARQAEIDRVSRMFA